jgi:type VI secretion system protein ImpC
LELLSKQSTGILLDEVIDKTLGGRLKREPQQSLSEWESFLNRIVQPHLVPDIEERQSEILAIVDATTGELMRAILHHPDYQAMEAAWRGLHFAVSRIEIGEELMLYLFDVSKAELAADLGSAEDLKATATYKLLVEQTLGISGEEPWAVLAGIYSFGETGEDAGLLGRMAKIAKATGAPFISSTSNTLLGCEPLAQTPDPRNWSQVGQRQRDEGMGCAQKAP